MIEYAKEDALHLLTGRRYTADEAIEAGIADGKAAAQDLLDRARTLASQLGGKEPGIFSTLKQTLFGPLADTLVAGHSIAGAKHG